MKAEPTAQIPWSEVETGHSREVCQGLGEGYDRVECNSGGAGWQVPDYAESVG